MCLAKVYLKRNNGDEIFLENVASVEVAEKMVIVTTILQETKKIAATIKRVDFANSNIILECFRS